METAISVNALSKTFIAQTHKKKVYALSNVTFDVYKGEILGVLGPNGAGKTTLLNILSTLLLPDAGEVRMFGMKLAAKNYYHLRRLLNMSSGYPNFPWSLTVEENLRFYGMLYGIEGKELNKKIKKLLEIFNLEGYARQRFDELSSGTKQRLSLAKALLNDPKIIFLDEPTVGLDPDIAIKTREIILNIHKETKATILLTTHNMHEAEDMCERIAFLKNGKLLKLATPAELKRIHEKEDLEEVFVALAHESEKPDTGERASPILISSKEFKEEAGMKENPWQGAKLWIRRTLAFTYRNFLFAARNLFSFMELIFWPVVSLLSIGLLGNYLALNEKALGFIMTGAIASGILQVTQLDVAYSLLYEVWSKSVKHTYLTPIGISECLFGSWLIGIARGSAIFAVLGIAAWFLFGFHFLSFGMVFIFLSGIFLSALLLGMFVTFLILIFGQKAEITAWMFAYLFMMVCGIYYPINTLPQFFYNIAQFIPITYFLEYFRQGFGFTPLLPHSLLKGFGLSAIYLVLELRMMEFAFYKARKNGVIVRLSE